MHSSPQRKQLSQVSTPRQAQCSAPQTHVRRLSIKAICIAALAVAIVIIYGEVFRDLIADWWNDPDYSYGFLVPPLAAYILWTNRKQYSLVPSRPSNAGIVIILMAVMLLLAGTLGADYFSTRISFCLLLAGIVVFLHGWGLLRAVAFPLAYLVLMIPLPGIIYTRITLPLQLVASHIAANLIELIGIPVFREGNILRVPNYSVEVALACSGIRSLLSLVALSVGYAYFADQRLWVRTALVLFTIPIGIATNAFRVTVTTLLGYRFGSQWAEGFLHLFSGWVIFLVALAFMFLLHAALVRIGSAIGGRARHV